MTPTQVRNDASTFEPFAIQAALGDGAHVAKAPRNLPSFRFKSFRMHDNLDLMRTCAMKQKTPSYLKENKTPVPPFLLLTRDTKGKERLFTPSPKRDVKIVKNKDKEIKEIPVLMVVEYLSHCNVSRLRVFEVRVWDTALHTFAKDSRQIDLDDQLTKHDTRVADLNESQSRPMTRYKPSLDNDLPILTLRRAVHDSGAMSLVMQFSACDSLNDAEMSRSATEIVSRVSMIHKKAPSLLVHHGIARRELGHLILQPKRNRTYRASTVALKNEWDNISGTNVV